jgi:hypothetical protein
MFNRLAIIVILLVGITIALSVFIHPVYLAPGTNNPSGSSGDCNGVTCPSGLTCVAAGKPCGDICCPNGISGDCNSRILVSGNVAPLASCETQCKPKVEFSCGANKICCIKGDEECIEQKIGSVSLGIIKIPIVNAGTCVPKSGCAAQGKSECKNSKGKVVDCCAANQDCLSLSITVQKIVGTETSSVYGCVVNKAKGCDTQNGESYCSNAPGSNAEKIAPGYAICCSKGTTCQNNANGKPYCYDPNNPKANC